MWFDKKTENNKTRLSVLELTINGQDIVYNQFNNVVATSINTVFVSASELMGWGFQSRGIGINEDIWNFINDKEARLFLTLVDENKKYIISPEEIRTFMKSNKTDYLINKTKLVVLPLTIFRNM